MLILYYIQYIAKNSSYIKIVSEPIILQIFDIFYIIKFTIKDAVYQIFHTCKLFISILNLS